MFIQIDGLALPVLRRAVRDGNVPTLSRWLRSGTHTLVGWETHWSSQTGASQAGLLHGNSWDMPAFRWLDKSTGVSYVTNHPSSAAAIEARQSDGRGLLHADGASRGNVFTGDAVSSSVTMSGAGRRRGRVGEGYYPYFANPYAAVRTILGFAAEVLRELWQAAEQRHRGVRPRSPRGGWYPLLRALTTVVTRDVTTQALIGDIYAGRSVIYADYVGYDEVAHHSGTERYETLETLRRIDRDIYRLEQTVADAAREYLVVVLSDHGQSQGEPFESTYGESLGHVVERALRTSRVDEPVTPPAGEHQALRPVVAAPTLDVDRGRSEAVVLASGSLGLIYLSQSRERCRRREIEERHPDLIRTLVGHPGIGFVVVADEQGQVAIGARGERCLATGEVRGQDPLDCYGPSAPWQVATVAAYPHCGDIMVQSAWDPQTEEVGAFEPLVGSHGGLGGDQTRPFVLVPSQLALPDEPVEGAEALHRVFRGWLAGLGHSAFASATEVSTTASADPLADPVPDPLAPSSRGTATDR